LLDFPRATGGERETSSFQWADQVTFLLSPFPPEDENGPSFPDVVLQ